MLDFGYAFSGKHLFFIIRIIKAIKSKFFELFLYINFREQFPTVQVELEPIFSGEGFEAARCNVKATHASGKQVAFSGITIAKFADGKLVEGWNGFDFLDMYQQLGYKLVDENV